MSSVPQDLLTEIAMLEAENRRLFTANQNLQRVLDQGDLRASLETLETSELRAKIDTLTAELAAANRHAVDYRRAALTVAAQAEEIADLVRSGLVTRDDDVPFIYWLAKSRKSLCELHSLTR